MVNWLKAMWRLIVRGRKPSHTQAEIDEFNNGPYWKG